MDAAIRQKLIDESVRVRNNAYAPFSKFLVGAALLTSDGEVFVGANVENSSYGLTCCAERSAIFAAVSQGNREFPAIAVASAGGHAPCGACRQVLAEFSTETKVLLVDADNPSEIEETTVGDLLPGSFHL